MKLFATLLLVAGISSAIATSFTLDLSTGAGSTSLPSGVTWYRSLSGSGPCGKYGTLKIDMTGRHHARFEFTFSSTKSGWLMNIGDSSTNNGWGGDGGTQSRDCEAHVRNSQFAVFRNDENTGQAYASNIVDEQFTAYVEDGLIAWDNHNGVFDWLLDTNLYYALNGQPDSEGNPNKDIYLGVNQVVSGSSSRRGSGLCEVIVTLF